MAVLNHRPTIASGEGGDDFDGIFMKEIGWSIGIFQTMFNKKSSFMLIHELGFDDAGKP